MANKWNYRHGSSLNLGFQGIPNSIIAPDDNVVGNVVYVDPSNPNSSDTAANRGCANVPYVTLSTAITEKGNMLFILGKGTYAGAPTPINYFSKSFLSDVFGNAKITFYISDNRIYGCVVQPLSNPAIQQYTAFNRSIFDSNFSFTGNNSLILKMSGFSPYSANQSRNVIINCNLTTDKALIYSLLYNCVRTVTNAGFLYNQVFWLGTLNYNSLTSDLNTICPLIGTTYPTENDAIAKVETDLGLAANTLKNNGFRLLNPHFVNPLKGNFNIDFLNYDCTAILALRDSWDWIINRGVRCEYPTDFVGAVGAGFGEEPNVSDGFNGALYSRNINSSGAITNTAYDTVLVSKKYTLPTAYTLENINFFDKLISTAFELNATENDGTDTPNCYTYYFIGVKVGVLESVFNSTNNTFSYTAGVLTCDFPRFMWNRSTQLNKDDNTIYGQIENGTFDLDYMRNIYKAGVKEFRIIAVKKGV